jgi:hypothetical protein
LFAGGAATHASANTRCIGPLCITKPSTSAPAAPSNPVPGTATTAQSGGGGKQCIDDLCLGDGLEALGKFNWETAYEGPARGAQPSGTRPLSRGDISRAEGRFHGNTQGVQGYLADKTFDKGALAGLARITAVCSPTFLTGVFKSESGNPTKVEIAMVADPANLSVQRWIVRSILREVPSATTREQRQQAAAQVRARYGDSVRLEEGNAVFNYSFRLPAISYEAGTLEQHPACGGSGGGPASID